VCSARFHAFALSFVLLLGAAVLLTASPPLPNYRSWSAYGGGPEQIRYSSLTQINTRNVASLRTAWTYDTGEPGPLQTQPLIVGGVLFGFTPTHKTFAVNAATGQELWVFDSGLRGQGPNRGLMYWTDGRRGRLFSAVDNFIYALDPATGKPIPSFGLAGRIDLREHLGRDPQLQAVRLTTPGVVYKDLIIVGGRLAEALPTSPGDVRAYDVSTGALRWSFHTIPHPGEYGYDSWPEQAWTYSGAANSWPGMALDEARGIVYVPTGSAASDFYAADRLGNDVFANCLVALDAASGKRLWHFQFVHHDIWDRDLPSPPSLITIHRNGRRIDAVAQSTKHGYVFVFNRVTGEPVFPIEELPFPPSGMPGEVTSPTQPLPSKPRPFARQRLTADMLSARTPEIHTWALDQFATFRSGGQFVPFAIDRPTVIFPGFDGGAEWGGQAFDPETGLYYVNANDLPWTGRLAPNTGGESGKALYAQHCASCHRDDREGSPPTIPALIGLAERKSFTEVVDIVHRGGGRMSGFPALDPVATNAIVEYVLTGQDTPARGRGARGTAPGAAGMVQSPLINNSFRFGGYNRFLDRDGIPAVQPPWGTLSAIDLNTGDYAWQVPLGEYPKLAAVGIRNTGSENYGGPVVTAGGLVFIGASQADNKFRAFDKANGTVLWETVMRAPGRATPATYEAAGRQFVVVAVGNQAASGGPNEPAVGGAPPVSAAYVAFSLPR